MKKTLLFFAVVGAFSLASCKKDRTCTCTTSYPDGSSDPAVVVTINKASKSSAKKACVSYTTSDASGVTTTKCDLK